MKQYNYLEEMKKDIREEVLEYLNYGGVDLYKFLRNECNDSMTIFKEELFELLHDILYDTVTGNGCYSYTCSIALAEEYVLPNLGLFKSACYELGYCLDSEEVLELITSRIEEADAMIRCYLFSKALAQVIIEISNCIDNLF